MKRAIAVLALLLATPAGAQIGPGEFDPPVGEDPSVGESSQQFFDDPPAGEAPSVGESSQQFFDDPDAGDAPSIGGANEPFEQPGEGAPYGRLRPFD